MDLKRNLLYVIGSVPGTKGSYVMVKDSNRFINLKYGKPSLVLPPFPAAPSAVSDIVSKASDDKIEWVMEAAEHDPFGMHDWDEPEPV